MFKFNCSVLGDVMNEELNQRCYCATHKLFICLKQTTFIITAAKGDAFQNIDIRNIMITGTAYSKYMGVYIENSVMCFHLN